MRLCQNVIQQIIDIVPEGNEEFVKRLEWHKNDAWYKAPEETIQWWRTSETLEEFVPEPKEEWHFKMVDIWQDKQ